MAITRRYIPGNQRQVEIQCGECAHRDFIARANFDTVKAAHEAEHAAGSASKDALREMARHHRRAA